MATILELKQEEEKEESPTNDKAAGDDDRQKKKQKLKWMQHYVECWIREKVYDQLVAHPLVEIVKRNLIILFFMGFFFCAYLYYI